MMILGSSYADDGRSTVTTGGGQPEAPSPVPTTVSLLFLLFFDILDWPREVREGFKNSDLSKQCLQRYKIYMERNAWSVNGKYILACDAMTLLVNPVYYDFFTRSLIHMKHFWPVDPNNLCESIIPMGGHGSVLAAGHGCRARPCLADTFCP